MKVGLSLNINISIFVYNISSFYLVCLFYLLSFISSLLYIECVNNFQQSASTHFFHSIKHWFHEPNVNKKQGSFKSSPSSLAHAYTTPINLLNTTFNVLNWSITAFTITIFVNRKRDGWLVSMFIIMSYTTVSYITLHVRSQLLHINSLRCVHRGYFVTVEVNDDFPGSRLQWCHLKGTSVSLLSVYVSEIKMNTYLYTWLNW